MKKIKEFICQNNIVLEFIIQILVLLMLFSGIGSVLKQGDFTTWKEALIGLIQIYTLFAVSCIFY